MDNSLVNEFNKSYINPDLQKERTTSTFSVSELTNQLDCTTEKTTQRRSICKQVFDNPVFQHPDQYVQDSSERYGRAIQKATELFRMMMENSWTIDDMRTAMTAIRYDVGLAIHGVMFIPTIEKLGTDAQKAKWLPKSLTLQVIGTYAQTEMGHGTFLRNLQTTATYDAKTEEFIVNTPFPEGMKFWPGGLGKSANHAIFMANLIINGESYGMQAFIVPIRSLDTHEPLPGVELGEIGPRPGLTTADNGYCVLRNVRIPRTYMLMKYARVTKDGKFERSGSDKVTYGSMMLVRSYIVQNAADQLSQAVTIATRYAAVRRQSELKPGTPEVQILDFQTQQQKLFPNIAMAYALHFTKVYMLKTYHKVDEEELQQGIFKSVPELHSQSAGLKAYCSDMAAAGTEVLRRACGGHGYLMSAGLFSIVAEAMAGVTYEGENTVMYLQTARYLMKSFASAASGEQLTWSVQYLSREPRALHLNTSDQLTHIDTLITACERRAYYVIERAAQRLQARLEEGQPQYLAWNDCSIQLAQAAKAHCDSFVCINFARTVQELACSPELKEVLTKLCLLHFTSRFLENAGEFVESGALTFDMMDHVRDLYARLLAELRPNAVSLVDAFDWHDGTLASDLGRYDGQVYEALYESAKRSKLNQTQVHPSYYKFIQPFQKKSKL